MTRAAGLASLRMLPDDWINPPFAPTAQAAEETVINVLIAAETMATLGGPAH